jgi:hypothetical protein
MAAQPTPYASPVHVSVVEVTVTVVADAVVEVTRVAVVAEVTVSVVAVSVPVVVVTWVCDVLVAVVVEVAVTVTVVLVAVSVVSVVAVAVVSVVVSGHESQATGQVCRANSRTPSAALVQNCWSVLHASSGSPFPWHPSVVVVAVSVLVRVVTEVSVCVAVVVDTVVAVADVCVVVTAHRSPANPSAHLHSNPTAVRIAPLRSSVSAPLPLPLPSASDSVSTLIHTPPLRQLSLSHRSTVVVTEVAVTEVAVLFVVAVVRVAEVAVTVVDGQLLHVAGHRLRTVPDAQSKARPLHSSGSTTPLHVGLAVVVVAVVSVLVDVTVVVWEVVVGVTDETVVKVDTVTVEVVVEQKLQVAGHAIRTSYSASHSACV